MTWRHSGFSRRQKFFN